MNVTYLLCVKWNESKVSERKQERWARGGGERGAEGKRMGEPVKSKQVECIVYLHNRSPRRRNNSLTWLSFYWLKKPSVKHEFYIIEKLLYINLLFLRQGKLFGDRIDNRKKTTVVVVYGASALKTNWDSGMEIGSTDKHFLPTYFPLVVPRISSNLFILSSLLFSISEIKKDTKSAKYHRGNIEKSQYEGRETNIKKESERNKTDRPRDSRSSDEAECREVERKRRRVALARSRAPATQVWSPASVYVPVKSPAGMRQNLSVIAPWYKSCMPVFFSVRVYRSI